MTDRPAKAAPSSDLSARGETVLWAAADVVFVAILVLLSVIFAGDTTSLASSYVVAPIIGWIIGNILAFALPRRSTIPSWAVVVVGLVLVVLCAVVFSQHAIAVGRGIAGLVIGLACGYLLLRAYFAAHHREGSLQQDSHGEAP